MVPTGRNTTDLQFTRLAAALPGLDERLAGEWLGERLVYGPELDPQAIRVGIASSRIPRPWHAWPEWFQRFRNALNRLRPGEVLYGVEGTSTAIWVVRAARLFQLPAILLHMPRKQESVAMWQRRVSASNCKEPYPILELFLSPALSRGLPPKQELAAIAPQDRALALASCRLELIFQRPGGAWQELIRLGKADPRFPGTAFEECRAPLQPAPARLPDVDCPPAVADDLLSRIATVEADPSREPLLIHWTRAPIAAWNGETRDDYENGLLQGTVAGPRTAFDTLRRILLEKTLRGSGRLLRHGKPMVCFTAAPLRSYADLRIYRPHLRRFDFEPYGFCFRQRKLQELGARPVIYGEPPLLDRLSPTDLPYFQVARAGRDCSLDWTLEREWRLAGDLDLRRFTAQELYLFVDRPQEAEQLRRESPWPVICLNDLRTQGCYWL